LRAILWHCLSYLGGDPLCVAKANRIIRAHYTPGPCHFAPGAAIDVLLHHRERLLPVAIDEGDHYVGLIPLRLTDRGQARKAHLQVLCTSRC
jgi:hypothetical protein